MGACISMSEGCVKVTFCIRLDKIDLLKCLEKGIRVINTPNVLTDDVADAAIRLANMAILKTISESDRLVKSGSWMKDDFGLATREQCRYPHFWADIKNPRRRKTQGTSRLETDPTKNKTKNFWDGDRSGHEEQKEELMGWRHRSSIYNRTYEEHTELLGKRVVRIFRLFHDDLELTAWIGDLNGGGAERI
ncbi:hydroxyphenylpyruvate reductase-like [Cucumis melo var. makuwa]|uniref:Hydroxyphenylpyruvate reductase-like n=1 Tax=Cucumis melo var. makuwa TaxID=1194695 RepID=A0A5A7VDW9_CUCMM|nr:hydroxyphenylpyruvate reductase-like [Cucumis melo var. makuwa]